MILDAICEICGEVYARIDTDNMFNPMRGEAFLSHDEFHGYPPPFQPDQDFETMRCIWGNHRPFINEGKIKTPQGWRVFKDRPIEKPDPKKRNAREKIKTRADVESMIEKHTNVEYQCDICGEVFNHRLELYAHKTEAHG